MASHLKLYLENSIFSYLILCLHKLYPQKLKENWRHNESPSLKTFRSHWCRVLPIHFLGTHTLQTNYTNCKCSNQQDLKASVDKYKKASNICYLFIVTLWL